MKSRQYLQIPGPTNVPEPVLRSLSTPMTNYRGPEFTQLVRDNVAVLKRLLATSGDVLIFPSSGSGALEASLVNLFSPGDTIISVSQGVFSQRYGTIARAFGLEVREIEKTLGQAVTPADIEQLLSGDDAGLIKAVCLPQNETATGVANDIEAIAQLIRRLNHPALLVVDGVSSVASVAMLMDEWSVDVVITASQKGLMLPPGLGIVALNDKAWRAVEQSRLPKWYWDFSAMRDAMAQGQFPYTPAVSLIYGLKVALELLEQEGFEQVWQRHKRNARLVRVAGRAIGLTTLADEAVASETVTAFMLPDAIEFSQLNQLVQTEYNIVLGGGLGPLAGKAFRVGHLGALDIPEIYAIMSGLELSLRKLGHAAEAGAAAKAISLALSE